MRVLGLFFCSLALVSLIFGQSFGLQFLDGAVIEFDKPAVVKGKEMTTFGGGGLRIRWQDQTYALIHAVPPSLKMGCGGIDISLGSLGLLNFEQFGKLFEALMGPAGVMFVAQLALSSLCPQCSEVLQQLMNLANQLNQMQISKCGAVQLAGAFGETLGRKIHRSLMKGDSTDSWVKEFDNAVKSVADYLQTLNQEIQSICPSGKCGLALMLKGSCIVEEAVKETTVANFLGYDNRTLAAIVRGYLGDVCFNGQKSIKDAYSGVPQNAVTPPSNLVGSPEDFITFIAGLVNTGDSNSGDVNGISCVGGVQRKFPFVSVNNQGDIEFQSVPVSVNTSICLASKQLVERIFDAIRNRSSLSDSDRAMLSSLPVGIFKLINYGSVYTGFLDNIRDDLAYYIAEEAAIGLLQKLTQKTAEWVLAYQSGLGQNDQSKKSDAAKAADSLLKNASEVQRELAKYRRYTIEQISKKVQSYDVANRIYNDMLAQMARSPIYANMVFTRLIGLSPVGGR